LVNSPRFDVLIRDGKLYLSPSEAIELALQDNFDLAIARYNLLIADADILRTNGGGTFRGVNTGIIQGTPGGDVGGPGEGAPGAGAGGTSGGAGGAGAGASGLVQSTLGVGTPVPSYDPTLTANVGVEHQASPQANLQSYGVPYLHNNVSQADFALSQTFPTGAAVSIKFDNFRETTNSPLGSMPERLLEGYAFHAFSPSEPSE
jgi:hypothetical protein